MAHHIQWYNDEKTLLLYQVEGAWTAQEFAEQIEHCHRLMAEQPHTVHVITDFSHAHEAPKHLLAVARLVDRSLPANRGMAIGVGVSPLLRLLFQTVQSLSPRVTQNAYILGSLEEALAFIAERQAPLTSSR